MNCTRSQLFTTLMVANITFWRMRKCFFCQEGDAALVLALQLLGSIDGLLVGRRDGGTMPFCPPLLTTLHLTRLSSTVQRSPLLMLIYIFL